MLSGLKDLKSILMHRPNECQLIVAIRGGEEYLKQELEYKKISVLWTKDRFFCLDKTSEPLLWIQWNCSEWELLEINSINDCVTKLKNYSLLWSYYSFDFHRRHSSIQQSFLYQGSDKRIQFPSDYSKFHQNRKGGFWTLLEHNLLLLAKKTSSWRYLGSMEFVENKEEPPSRAYLKLWEIFMRLSFWPKENEVVMDLGACPGGWTWVLRSFARKVISVDKAPLVEYLMRDDKVTYLQESIFALNPADWNHVDWIFCDVICYPEKILQLITKWLDAGFKGISFLLLSFKLQQIFPLLRSCNLLEDLH